MPDDRPELVVFNHHPATGPSAFAPVLDGRGNALRWRSIEVAEDEPLPPAETLGGLAGLIVMGGPMGVPDRDEHPWMDAEIALIAAAVDAEIPVLGVCLGAQLTATALGGRVERRATPEFGYLALTRTEAGRADGVAAGWPDGAAPLFSHEDEVVELPDGAEPLLAGNDGIPAWRCGSAHTVQFHPEVTVEQLEDWRAVLEELLERTDVDIDAFLDEARRRERYSIEVGAALLGRWLDTQVLPRARGEG